jgi:hypothetical protein
MIPTITAFESSPDRGQGLARDMRVRWALEEAGQPYEVRLVSFSARFGRDSGNFRRTDNKSLRLQGKFDVFGHGTLVPIQVQ